MENNYFIAIAKMLGALALLIFGMKLMSDSLQKMTGPHLRRVLSMMASNRVSAMLTGVLVTVAVQSSTATTVMTVSFVNAGLLSLFQAIAIIMGANIGTTLTAWIMSAGFSMNITDFVWPAFIIAIYILYKKRGENFANFIFGVAFMFLSIGVLANTGKEMDLAHNTAVINFFASFNGNSYFTILLFLLIGTILTCIVQSSAALMAITMVLCTSGVLPIYQGIALVMGENIGTTLTANLAAMTANAAARRAALAHLFFNMFGVIWILIVFYPFVDMITSFVGISATGTQDPVRLSVALAAFHSAFNLTNTFILIWFIPAIERFCFWVIKPKESDKENDFRLKYIQGGLMETPELSVIQASREISHYAQRMQRMLSMVHALVAINKDDDFDKQFKRIEKYETIADNMEVEIGQYLGMISNAHVSEVTKLKLRSMQREISEIESIGDACYNMARALQRYNAQNLSFSEYTRDEINNMICLVDKSVTEMQKTLDDEALDLAISRNLEQDINNMRNKLKEKNIDNMNEGRYNYNEGSAFIDIISECEKLGDYVINVVEAHASLKM